MFPVRDTQPSHSFPIVTVLLITVNIIVFFQELLLPQWELNHLISHYGVVATHFQYQDLLTSLFLHGGWLHLLSNMWFLWIFGDNVEDILGHVKYLAFYLICGVASSLVQVSFTSGSAAPLIGASGAIAGVMGAYLVRFPRSTVITVVFFGFLFLLELPAAVVLIFWFVLQVFSGAGSIAYSQLSRGGTAWFAHIGGFLTGMALVYALGTRERFRNRRDFAW